MRKTLIFRNIQKDHRKESWDQIRIILANKIKKKMRNIDHEVIIKKIESAHRAKENRPERNLKVIAKIHRLEFFRGSENQFHQSSERWKRPHPDLRLANVLTCINHATQ